MDRERVRQVYDASEQSWEAASAQWVTVFDVLTKMSDRRLAPMEQAVWNTYTQARELRKLVSELWVEAVTSSQVDAPAPRFDAPPRTA